MAIYVEKCNGYIVDVPNIDFIRCDKTPYHYDKVSTAGLTNTHNVLAITGGQGRLPLAQIDTDSTLEFTYASSEWDLDMFAMANATNVTEGDYGTQESERYEVETGLKLTVPYEVQPGSVKIRGLEETAAGTASAGEFKVAITAATEEVAGKAEITLNEADAAIGDTVRVYFKRRVVAGHKVAVSNNSTTAKGELYLHYPVYSTGTDCSEAAIKGWLHIYVPRVRVTALPGFDSSYKSAQTQSLTFAAINAGRTDNLMIDYLYEETDPDGNIVTKSAATVDWD